VYQQAEDRPPRPACFEEQVPPPPRPLAEQRRKRTPFRDVGNELDEAPPRRRSRRSPPNDACDKKVAVQRFSLVSRGAPPIARAPVQHDVLRTPPTLTAQLGPGISVCRCSECPKGGGAHRDAGAKPRLCRRDTESHPEYELLLGMSRRFLAECPARADSPLVGEACCREKSAYFILDPEATVVGYVAAVVAANRKVAAQKTFAVWQDTKDVAPTVLQIWVEPEFRRRGVALAALGLLLRGHETARVDTPTWPVIRLLESLGFVVACTEDCGEEGRPVVLFVKSTAVGGA